MKKLNEIPGINPFKVPNNYFEEVNRKIISVASESKSEEKRFGIYRRFRPYLTIAASVAGFIIVSYFTVKLLTVDKNKNNISEIVSMDNPELYLNEIDVFSLEEDLASLETDEVSSGVSRTEIIDYLISENIEINDIYNHF